VNVLYLTSDLLFSSRVASVARQCGANLVVVGSLDRLREMLAAGPSSGVIIDLEHREADPAAIATMVGEVTPGPTVIAYGPHVKEQLLAAARDNGFDTVLSRGQFDQRMGPLLQSLSRMP
jgi:hypothetical protein